VSGGVRNGRHAVQTEERRSRARWVKKNDGRLLEGRGERGGGGKNATHCARTREAKKRNHRGVSGEEKKRGGNGGLAFAYGAREKKRIRRT